jgi:hypothetical protein
VERRRANRFVNILFLSPSRLSGLFLLKITEAVVVAAGFRFLLSAGKKNPSTLFILFFEKYKIRGRRPGAICRGQGISYGGFIQIYKNCYLFL